MTSIILDVLADHTDKVRREALDLARAFARANKMRSETHGSLITRGEVASDLKQIRYHVEQMERCAEQLAILYRDESARSRQTEKRTPLPKSALALDSTADEPA